MRRGERGRRLLGALLAAPLLLLAASAAAEEPRLAAMRDGVHELQTREGALRERAARAAPKLRHETGRVVDEADRRRRFVETRLDVYALLGKERVADADLRVVEERYEEADRLLATVEAWFEPR